MRAAAILVVLLLAMPVALSAPAQKLVVNVLRIEDLGCGGEGADFRPAVVVTWPDRSHTIGWGTTFRPGEIGALAEVDVDAKDAVVIPARLELTVVRPGSDIVHDCDLGSDQRADVGAPVVLDAVGSGPNAARMVMRLAVGPVELPTPATPVVARVNASAILLRWYPTPGPLDAQRVEFDQGRTAVAPDAVEGDVPSGATRARLVRELGGWSAASEWIALRVGDEHPLPAVTAQEYRYNATSVAARWIPVGTYDVERYELQVRISCEFRSPCTPWENATRAIALPGDASQLRVDGLTVGEPYEARVVARLKDGTYPEVPWTLFTPRQGDPPIEPWPIWRAPSPAPASDVPDAKASPANESEVPLGALLAALALLAAAALRWTRAGGRR